MISTNPSPLFGDKVALTGRRVFNTLRNGDLIVKPVAASDTIALATYTYTYAFLTGAEADEFATLINSYLGQLVSYRGLDGYIMNPTTEIIDEEALPCAGNNVNRCRWSVTIDFLVVGI